MTRQARRSRWKSRSHPTRTAVHVSPAVNGGVTSPAEVSEVAACELLEHSVAHRDQNGERAHLIGHVGEHNEHQCGEVSYGDRRAGTEGRSFWVGRQEGMLLSCCRPWS